MITLSTPQGKQVEIVLENELHAPMDMGAHVRAYCHIHGSDHQRSLSITKATGWGHCFNATCGATVLVAEWNRPVAQRLLHFYYRGLTSAAMPSYQPPSMESRHRPSVVQPMLLPPPKSIPPWQQDERDALRALDEQMRRALADSQRARMYLHERGIPLRVALATGVGYIGRALWHWQPGMNETTHKAVLERPGSPKRWIKTNPAGWFGVGFERVSNTVLLVEGAFDRLTLLAAGFQQTEIVALVGTAAPVEWFPTQVNTVVLALDGDNGGTEASSRLAEQLTQVGLHVQLCSLSQDTWGKDWNERWQRLGQRSVAPVFEVFSEARGAWSA